jgi:hypothetical protein
MEYLLGAAILVGISAGLGFGVWLTYRLLCDMFDEYL